MKRKIIIGAFFGIGVCAFLRLYSPHVEGVYSLYRLDGLRPVHLIVSDNGTPADFSDDWVIDWEYR